MCLNINLLVNLSSLPGVNTFNNLEAIISKLNLQLIQLFGFSLKSLKNMFHPFCI